TLIAIHPRGHVEVEVPPGAKTVGVTAQPWGRIEGTLRWGDKPGANQPIWLSSLRPNDKPFINYLQEATTDLQGRFVFDRVAPGHTQVSWSPEGYLAAWDHVTVGPGATVHVPLGDQGLPVVGRVALAPEVASAAGERPAIDITIFPPPPSVSGA